MHFCDTLRFPVKTICLIRQFVDYCLVKLIKGY